MRNEKDRIKIRVHAYFVADLDLERVEQDPRWAMLGGSNSLTPAQAQEKLFKYINQYVLAGPQLLTNAPCTNGPSDVWVSKMEILDDRSNTTVP